MPSYQELRGAADAVWKAVTEPARPLFIVSINTSSLASGADETLAILRKLAGYALSDDGRPTTDDRAAAPFDVMQTGDTGMSWAEPVVQVTKPGGQSVLYGHVTPDKAEAFAKAALAGVATGFAIGTVSGSADGVPALASLDWMAGQTRWIMFNCGVIDPEDIDHYVARGGYASFVEATKMSPEALIDVVKGSTLKGRSGSAFSTGTKWDFLRTATAEPKYLVCNADEGDPGAWVNRVVMESDPHMLLEGMLLAARASGATYGWIYIRDEYPLAIARVNRALEQAREKGIIGENALGTGVKFDAEVVRGAGAYVCGDETGLISSVNDERGMPRLKPPFPAQSGVLAKPTNVNNVETYACALTLMRLGGETFSTVGTEANRGTKLFTVSGKVARTGCVEVPFGTKVKDLLALVGGIEGGRQWKGIQQGGPLSGLLPAHVAADMALEPEPFRPLGAGMGGGGFVFLDDTCCVVDINVMTSWFLEAESCARCTTCRIGNQRMLEILRRAAHGQGQPGDVDHINSLAESMKNSNCLHGGLSMVIINNTMQFFREEYDAHALEHRCPAKICPDLIRYRVVSQRDHIADAAAICPTGAIKGQPGAWSIDDAACIRCDACRDVADGDIIIEDRYADTIPLRVVAPADVARAGG